VRLPVAVMFLAVLPAMLWETGDRSPVSEASAMAVAIYDPDPAHIWNRLYAALLVRADRYRTRYVADSLDPPLWLETEHLLAGPSHPRALKVLDEFLQTHAENLIRDPVKRALLQRDLWAVFDWSVQQTQSSKRPDYTNEKRELQTRLAEVIRRLALSPKEIEALPDNYAQAIASGEFAKAYDPAHPDRPLLPPDLFDPRGPWFWLEDQGGGGPLALSHVTAFSGRSSFLVFIRLPGGRKATVDYLQTLWNFPQPWVQGPDFAADQAVVNPGLPSFPAGTEVALVRQLTLFDNQGNLAPAPVIESVQMRVYRDVTATPARYFGSGDMAEVAKNSGQDFYQITLSRPLLFSNKAGGLRAPGRDERELSTFQQKGDDLIDDISEKPALKDAWPPALQTCLMCHSGGGVRSLNSLEKLLKPNRRQQDFPGAEVYTPGWWLNAGTPYWKQDRYEWGLLNGYWKAAARRQ
jgi:hypothetical protein